MEIATPRYSHVKNYENVYEPAEDTFLLLDSLQSEQTFIKNLRYIALSNNRLNILIFVL